MKKGPASRKINRKEPIEASHLDGISRCAGLAFFSGYIQSVAMNKHSPTVKRLMRECKELGTSPPPGVIAKPLDNNLFEWHFTISGVEKTHFEGMKARRRWPSLFPFQQFTGGRYHGKLLFPSEYPFKPPNLIMMTPSGRFEVGKKICLNFSGYHPEQWQPSWTISGMLTALRAFFETRGTGAIGAIEVNPEQRRKLAKASLRFVCNACHAKMSEMFQSKPLSPTNDDQSDESEISDSDEEQSANASRSSLNFESELKKQVSMQKKWIGANDSISAQMDRIGKDEGGGGNEHLELNRPRHVAQTTERERDGRDGDDGKENENANENSNGNEELERGNGRRRPRVVIRNAERNGKDQFLDILTIIAILIKKFVAIVSLQM